MIYHNIQNFGDKGQAYEFRSAIGKCRPDWRPILMSGRQKVADLNFALE